MKRVEVIERLKSGDKIIVSQGFDCPAFFPGIGDVSDSTVNYTTYLWLRKQNMIAGEKSKTAHGVSYWTWNEEKDEQKD